MRFPLAAFQAGDYQSFGDAWRDAVSRLEGFEDTAKVAAKNAVIHLIDRQGGVITCDQVVVITGAIADALSGATYGEVL